MEHPKSTFESAFQTGESVRELPPLPVEHLVVYGIQWLKLAVEILGAVSVAIGVSLALWGLAHAVRQGVAHRYDRFRLTLTRYLVVALEFQLAADILSTAIAPSWNQIGKLAAIAIIRTLLNYFLLREMHAEEAVVAGVEGSADRLFKSSP